MKTRIKIIKHLNRGNTYIPQKKGWFLWSSFVQYDPDSKLTYTYHYSSMKEAVEALKFFLSKDKISYKIIDTE